MQRLVRDLNEGYRATPALWTLDTAPEGFGWIDANDAAGNVLSFLRFDGAGGVMLPASRTSPPYRTRTTGSACLRPAWRETLNTDAGMYGGSGVGNLGGIEAAAPGWHGRPASAALTLPPLGVLWLTPAP